MSKVILHSPLDMHLHLREGEMLKKVANYSAKNFSGAMVMPNTKVPITTKEQLKAYKKEILKATKDEVFEPYMTLYLTDDLKIDELEELREHIIALKLYPKGATTNSERGSASIFSEHNISVFKEMENLGIPLSIHGETDGFVLDREAEFAEIYKKLAVDFPKLKIIMEHISSKECASLIGEYENLYATITAHHIYITLDDLIGGSLNPHNFCKPVVKSYEDKEAIVALALSGSKNVMFGSDSAPHPKTLKESAKGAAGIFSAPVCLELIVQFFESNGKLDNLQDFISDNALRIYGVKPPKKEITLIKKEWVVPALIESEVVPFMAEERVFWQIDR